MESGSRTPEAPRAIARRLVTFARAVCTSMSSSVVTGPVERLGTVTRRGPRRPPCCQDDRPLSTVILRTAAYPNTTATAAIAPSTKAQSELAADEPALAPNDRPSMELMRRQIGGVGSGPGTTSSAVARFSAARTASIISIASGALTRASRSGR